MHRYWSAPPVLGHSLYQTNSVTSGIALGRAGPLFGPGRILPDRLRRSWPMPCNRAAAGLAPLAMTQPTQSRPWRNFYGRRKGKSLRASQEAYLATDLDALSPGPVGWEANPKRRPLDLEARFPGAQGIWLEIGFGGGEHMVHQAAANPTVAVIGCDPFVNGVAMLLGKIRAAGVRNLAVYPGDARDVLDVLPPASLARAFLLYPDPWPKKRHHRRRFVTAEFLNPLARAMAPGAEFRVATDIGDYVRQTLVEVLRTGAFAWQADTAQDWRQPWPDWSPTRYEQKALREGRTPHYLTFRRH